MTGSIGGGQKERLSYTRYQTLLLNDIFASIHFPNTKQKQLIAKRVGISKDQVKVSTASLKVLVLVFIEAVVLCSRVKTLSYVLLRVFAKPA